VWNQPECFGEGALPRKQPRAWPHGGCWRHVTELPLETTPCWGLAHAPQGIESPTARGFLKILPVSADIGPRGAREGLRILARP